MFGERTSGQNGGFRYFRNSEQGAQDGIENCWTRNRPRFYDRSDFVSKRHSGRSRKRKRCRFEFRPPGVDGFVLLPLGSEVYEEYLELL